MLGGPGRASTSSSATASAAPYFGETDDTVNKKVHAALERRAPPHSSAWARDQDQRELGVTMEFISYQAQGSPGGRDRRQDMRQVVIAYEPIWAIGTGNTATAEQAERGLRRHPQPSCRKLYGARDRPLRHHPVRRLHERQANAEALLAQPDVDGGLIGGASLDPDKFLQIIHTANQD